ncbi:hypothetical protein LEP1GSC166_0089 [Leptospira kirschneri]|nr:hypothetical protein LEP1GSC198_0679 [Leptospira kirschneri str. JB]EMK03299.1 hypothetical protein LEP1GSC166_0089 [Leptospira kirschneri]
MFQNLECKILSKKPTILGLVQFCEGFCIFKKIPVNFWHVRVVKFVIQFYRL